MSLWLKLTLEMGFLLLLGVLYYLYQRKRVIRQAQDEVCYLLDELLFKLNHFLEENPNHEKKEPIKCFIEGLEKCEDFKQVNSVHIPEKLPEDFKENFETILYKFNHIPK